jgi:uncharacterized membrane protein
MRFLAAYGATLAVFLGLDFTWLTLVARGLYIREIGPLLLPQGRIGPAIAFYLLYIAGVVVFVVAPALERGRWRRAPIQAAFFGLVAYSCYDLTNLATLKGFSATLTVVDLAWGAIATAVAATAGYAAGRLSRPSPGGEGGKAA